LAAVEAADALIVGTPVYRASFTGLFKHFFDFVEQTALVDVPVYSPLQVAVTVMHWC
jgi:FMN reductase